MLEINSREYKLMLHNRWFADPKNALQDFWREVTAAAARVSVATRGKFDEPEQRTITFFDTVDHLIRRNGLVFRRREKGKRIQFTVKARNEDRYIASSFDLGAADRLDTTGKFEEDIAAPFNSRYSHSNKVKFRKTSDSPIGDTPKTVKDAATLFPLLGKVRVCGQKIDGDCELLPVNGIVANERVFEGPEIQLGKDTATAALILWSNEIDGRPTLAEFSFRYKGEEKEFSAKTARLARRLFEAIQKLDWFNPDSKTKTQYVYR